MGLRNSPVNQDPADKSLLTGRPSVVVRTQCSGPGAPEVLMETAGWGTRDRANSGQSSLRVLPLRNQGRGGGASPRHRSGGGGRSQLFSLSSLGSRRSRSEARISAQVADVRGEAGESWARRAEVRRIIGVLSTRAPGASGPHAARQPRKTVQGKVRELGSWNSWIPGTSVQLCTQAQWLRWPQETHRHQQWGAEHSQEWQGVNTGTRASAAPATSALASKLCGPAGGAGSPGHPMGPYSSPNATYTGLKDPELCCLVGPSVITPSTPGAPRNNESQLCPSGALWP